MCEIWVVFKMISEKHFEELKKLEKQGIHLSEYIVGKISEFAQQVDKTQKLYDKYMRGEEEDTFILHIFSGDLEKSIEDYDEVRHHEHHYFHANYHIGFIKDAAKRLIRLIDNLD